MLVPSNVTGSSIVLPQAPCNMGSHLQTVLACWTVVLVETSFTTDQVTTWRPNPIIPMASVLENFEGARPDGPWSECRF